MTGAKKTNRNSNSVLMDRKWDKPRKGTNQNVHSGMPWIPHPQSHKGFQSRTQQSFYYSLAGSLIQRLLFQCFAWWFLATFVSPFWSINNGLKKPHLQEVHAYFSQHIAQVTVAYEKIDSLCNFPSTEQKTEASSSIVAYSTAHSRFWTILLEIK